MLVGAYCYAVLDPKAMVESFKFWQRKKQATPKNTHFGLNSWFVVHGEQLFL